MNITFTDRRGKTQRLSSVARGRVVQFRDSFHQNHKTDSPFLVGYMCHTYIPRGYEDKVPVIDLRTGRLSLVDNDRQVWLLRADVTITE